MINERLCKIRKKLLLSQADISTQTGISYRAYSSYERGERKPSIEFLELLVTKFNINLNYLVAGIGEMFIANAQQFEQEQEVFAQKVRQILKEEKLIK